MSGSSSHGSVSTGLEGAIKLEQVEAQVRNIGERAFDENHDILRRVLLRGARSFVVGAVGIIAFSVSLKWKRDQLEKERIIDDPTHRYLSEMRSIGFDVDELEDQIVTRNANTKSQGT